MIRLKAKELSSDPEFNASPGWYTKWKRRHAICMRSKTSLAQRLPADMEDKVVEFHRFVLRARQHCGYESSQILNMDETPMTPFQCEYALQHVKLSATKLREDEKKIIKL